ncbi:hypothetical protein ONZ51_g6169 [Trametes cubensis]|uniref:Uncharacterized protein n=1 Tax=Trametes cubensis TaxID=1111947 RepID=A0AAD7TV66_9APHY|nr:hypothetical protein ONZ51_g6169 [Trametes cubensis]
MSTGSDSDTNTNAGSSLFQSAGGPPLILVCIAGGLLFGAFVGMLLMKRLRPVVVVQRVNAFPGDAEVPLGEKPQLYDIHLVSALEEGGELPPWAHFSPFAATYLPSDDESKTAPSARRFSPAALSRIMARLHRHSRSSKGHNAPPPGVLGLRNVQLVFAVSMPNPALSMPKSAHHDMDDDDCHELMPDCCIGTTVHPYHPEPAPVIV